MRHSTPRPVKSKPLRVLDLILHGLYVWLQLPSSGVSWAEQKTDVKTEIAKF